MYLKMTPLLRIKFHFFAIFTIEITCAYFAEQLTILLQKYPSPEISFVVDVTRSHLTCCCITSGTESEGAEERFCVYVGDRVAATFSEQGIV